MFGNAIGKVWKCYYPAYPWSKCLKWIWWSIIIEGEQ